MSLTGVSTGSYSVNSHKLKLVGSAIAKANDFTGKTNHIVPF